MKTSDFAKVVLLLFGAVCFTFTTYAWKRLHHSTVEVVQRAELVVVGKVKPDSIVLVPHTPHHGEGASWEHHCELLIAEVLKGTSSVPSMTISINYGLDPLLGGYISNQYGFLDLRSVRTNYPPDIIEVFDRGNSDGTYVPITGDIRTNHIWLLRRAQAGHADGMVGVYDPQDIQLVGMRGEILRYLSYLK